MKAKYFFTLDLNMTYYQVILEEDSKKYIVFIYKEGYF
jgi:hypothetical protein